MEISRSEARKIGSLCEEQTVKWRMSIESNEGEHAAAENAMTELEAERYEEIGEAFKRGEDISIS